MSNERPLILVTCDDGVRSPGLRAAVRAVLPLGEVMVAAPLEQQTGAGRSLFSFGEGSIARVDCEVDGHQVQAYTLHASPAQVVLHALLELVPRRPALCVSGINFGENVGSRVTSSGTLGAAIEAAADGVPALAASLETDQMYHHQHSEEIDFAAATYFTRTFAARLLDRKMPPDVDVLKLDVPDDATPATLWRVTRLSREGYFRALPSGRRTLADKRPLGYDIAVDLDRLEADSDVHALMIDRVVAVTPISLDLTSRVLLSELQALLKPLEEEEYGR
jgi:5'-nucleotidase